MRFLHWVWLPIVDAFRTLAACPPPAIRAVFEQTRVLADTCSERRISIGSPSSGNEVLPDAAIHSLAAAPTTVRFFMGHNSGAERPNRAVLKSRVPRRATLRASAVSLRVS
jgi:hypothetical protein